MKSKKIDKAMEARIQKLIDVYCTFMFGVDRDAGWHAPSQLESLVTACNKKRASFQRKQLTVRFAAGDERQANDRADEKMIDEMRFVRKKHYDFELAKMLFSKLEDRQLLALLAGRYLKHVYKREHTNQEVANYLEVEIRSLRHSKTRAINIIEQHISFLDQHDQLKIA
jgi:hypothetical protein